MVCADNERSSEKARSPRGTIFINKALDRVVSKIKSHRLIHKPTDYGDLVHARNLGVFLKVLNLNDPPNSKFQKVKVRT